MDRLIHKMSQLSSKNFSKMSRKSFWVWTYFNDSIKHYAICKHCGAIVLRKQVVTILPSVSQDAVVTENSWKTEKKMSKVFRMLFTIRKFLEGSGTYIEGLL